MFQLLGIDYNFLFIMIELSKKVISLVELEDIYIFMFLVSSKILLNYKFSHTTKIYYLIHSDDNIYRPHTHRTRLTHLK